MRLRGKPNIVKVGTATIPTSGATSNVIDLKGGVLAAIVTPANLRSVASLTFTTADDSDGTFTILNDSTTSPITVTMVASTTHGVSPLVQAAGCRQFIKVVGDDAATGEALLLDIYARDVSN